MHGWLDVRRPTAPECHQVSMTAGLEKVAITYRTSTSHLHSAPLPSTPSAPTQVVFGSSLHMGVRYALAQSPLVDPDVTRTPAPSFVRSSAIVAVSHYVRF